MLEFLMGGFGLVVIYCIAHVVLGIIATVVDAFTK